MNADEFGTWLSPSDSQRLAIVFVVCTVALALLSGTTLWMEHAWRIVDYGPNALAPSIFEVYATRADGAPAVVTAAMLALFITIHRQPLPSGPRVRMIQLWPVLIAIPIIAPVAACLRVGTAFVVAYQAFGLQTQMYWGSRVGFIFLRDSPFGLLRASISGLLLMVVAPFAIRISFAKLRRLRIIIAAALLTSFTVNALADVIAQAAHDAFFRLLIS